ncbi:alpha/beta hydrolase [Corynebacterium vitaeruminis]|uniref:alpha/beta hydrolase n=1 Tax=Corynebacterium vitaeruminis TaxID=38305 RepID=UPI00065F98F5|nr:alpha/beta hydrolase family protein [Corynebacterium vitaeruminis]
MKTTSTFRGWRRKVAAVASAVAVAASAFTMAPAASAAGDRGSLRPGCEWDSYKYFTQKCRVYSPAMDRTIPVQIVASANGGNKALYLLDGLRSPVDASDWVERGNAPRTFEGSNINLVIPGGGGGSFYTDWIRPTVGPNGPEVNKWETFLTQELPVYLEREFGISRTGNSVAGLSMGASAALSLAYNHRDQFGQALAFSGYLHTTAPGMHTAIEISQRSAGYNSIDMWGAPMSKERVRNDPYLNVERMKGLDLVITSANGVPDEVRDPKNLYRAIPKAGGVALESLAHLSTREFELRARTSGLDATFEYDKTGVHDWPTWERNLQNSKARIEGFLGA